MALIVESMSAFIERRKARQILDRALRDAHLAKLPDTRSAVREFVHLRVYPRVANFAGTSIADALLTDLEPVLRGRSVVASGIRGTPSIERERTSTPLDLVQKPVLLACSLDPTVAVELKTALAGRVMVREIGGYSSLFQALATASAGRVVVLADAANPSLDLGSIAELEAELPGNVKCVVWSRHQGTTLPSGLAPLAIDASVEDLALDLIAFLCDEV
jgi:hypothetical protein